MSFNLNPKITCGMGRSQYRYSTAKGSEEPGQDFNLNTIIITCRMGHSQCH